MISVETGVLYTSGGIDSQPDWYVELLGWFLPVYSDLKFYSRVKSVLGEQPKEAAKSMNKPRTNKK